MDLVMDANIAISAIISTEGKTCDLLFSDSLELYAPEFLLEELEEHKNEIVEKSKLTDVEFETAFSFVFSNVTLIPFEEFKKFIKKAGKITPDEGDIEYFALALKLGCPIWSNDKKLQKQKYVQIISTSELLELLKK
ncbi:MAG: PIN domain-containing protein [Candidatus Micrarchaeota archaeon]